MASLPVLPTKFKSLQHYLTIAKDHEQRDPVVSYYARLYSLQQAMKIDRKDPQCKSYLLSLMDCLETTKKTYPNDEAIQNEIVGQAHVENYAYKLFVYADNEDRAAKFSKALVKSFYTAGMIFDILQNFGELNPEVEKARKYSKWKAAYIHKCLKQGIPPEPGPIGADDEDALEFPTVPTNFGSDANQPSTSIDFLPPQPRPSNQPSPPPQARDPSPPRPAPRATSPHGDFTPSSEQMVLAAKYTKYAQSALTYEDTKTAITNLSKALNLLTTGKEI